MVFKCCLQVLDQESRGLHFYLDASDTCWYIGDYTRGKGYSYGPINQLICNLKKHPNLRVTNPNAYRYKGIAIRQVVECFRKVLDLDVIEEKATLVPIPPSKTRGHPEFDDRIEQVCAGLVQGMSDPDARPLVQAINDMEPTHNSEHKPKPDELIANYQIVAPEGYQPRDVVLLIDDVLTTGTHFKACQQLIIDSFPGVEVYGLFVSRRVFPEDDFEELFCDI